MPREIGSILSSFGPKSFRPIRSRLSTFHVSIYVFGKGENVLSSKLPTMVISYISKYPRHISENIEIFEVSELLGDPVSEI
ncbi:predicted protein [Sclerotinia sclerotiorum 1980 UF-70]|uniref:Uncharacterized protein n=1 Tax=Sclerotinia sclerotiorum (strain ATCC 18683 / 1980 / Ss-1) TaxID=665079 RepID=A7ED60_SCLS1|nr:predicted protein [Sclerotinia sclerotiorum 1980 UF-70]EDO00776.1 predicted protein [Sclerotinia sclerotiorum 1980 UF-70]